MLLKYNTSSYSLIIFCISLLFIAGCSRTKKAPKPLPVATGTQEQEETLSLLPLEKDAPKKEPVIEAKPATPQAKKVAKAPKLKKRSDSIYNADDPNELDFDVENKTGKTLFVASFSYQRRRNFERWRWIKSPVYEIAPYQTVTIDVDTIPEKLDRTFVFGYLGIFSTKGEADDAVFELLKDKQKLDLDQLINLKGKKVTLLIENYGMKGEVLDYDFVCKKELPAGSLSNSDLVFAVENKTGKIIFVTCFVYQKNAKGSWIGATEEKDDMTPWHYNKTSILRLDPDQIGEINAATIITMRDKSYVRGELAIFDQSQEKEAYASTYELLPRDCKLSLGPLTKLAGKKIVLDVENYGIMQDYFNYTIKPVKRINFQNVHKK